MVLLSLTVVAYDFQFYDIPSSMYVNAYEFESWQLPPTEYVDVSSDGSFRAEAYSYVLASNIVRYPVEIPPGSSAEWWFEQRFNYSEGDINIEYFGDFYRVQVRYHPVFFRAPLEYMTFWTVNIGAAIAWVLFLADSLVNSHNKKLP